MGWDRIRGHDAARRQIDTAFRRGRLAHAYLFVGPDGVGKRLFAGEFAKALLCESPPRPLEPCDRCPACVQVTAGTHPDCFSAQREKDKNELTVEAMRAFCGRLALKPTRGGRKVGIVEEADEFNPSSANAFLKPLEEPPPGSLLLLLATSTDRQLPTILSRCQVVPFPPLSPADLRAVLADHGVTDRARADRLTRLSGGSPGRALALNDESVWGFRETLLAGLTAARPDPVALSAAWVQFAEEAGKQAAAQRERASLVLRLLVELLQLALRLALTGEAGAVPPADADAARLTGFAERLGPDRLTDALEACADADTQIGRYIQVGLVIEALLGKILRVQQSK